MDFSHPLPPDYVTRYDSLDSDISAQRIHELALQRFCYTHFFVRQGYPTPVIFATPRDAFGEFTKLWQNATNPTNPFNYLLQCKDERGTPLYEPYPANVRYPLISIERLGTQPRASQTYSIHRYRRLFWPTVSSDVVRQQLGNVAQAQMAQAWDFRFQLEHYCTKPSTHATFTGRLRRAFNHFASIPQTYVVARYPGYYGPQFLRLYMEGGINDISGTEFDDKPVDYRCSCTVVMEGYEVYLDMDYMPALWRLAVGTSTVSPNTLDRVFDFHSAPQEWDLRLDGGENPVVNQWKPPLPEPGTDSGTEAGSVY